MTVAGWGPDLISSQQRLRHHHHLVIYLVTFLVLHYYNICLYLHQCCYCYLSHKLRCWPNNLVTHKGLTQGHFRADTSALHGRTTFQKPTTTLLFFVVAYNSAIQYWWTSVICPVHRNVRCYDCLCLGEECALCSHTWWRWYHEDTEKASAADDASRTSSTQTKADSRRKEKEH